MTSENKQQMNQKAIDELQEAINRDKNLVANCEVAIERIKDFYAEAGGSGSQFIWDLINSLIDGSELNLSLIYKLDQNNYAAIRSILDCYVIMPGDCRLLLKERLR